MNFNFTKFITKHGLSWHDLYIITALLETSWWLMFTLVDGADVILRLGDSTKVEYHPFLIVQKSVSCVKLFLALVCIWYGTVVRGKELPLRVYLIIGVVVDIVLILSWIFVSIEESWPLSPTNVYGLHYILTFTGIRVYIYWILYASLQKIFTSEFSTPTVGTVNGNVVGIPDQVGNNNESTTDSGNNLGFLGKGFKAVLEYYRMETEKAYMIAILWDVTWSFSIILSQELPETIFHIIFIGLFGSLPLNIPTENLAFRSLRVLLGLIGILIVRKKFTRFFIYWIAAYAILLGSNAIFFCYTATSLVIDETVVAITILCTVFIASNAGKFFVLFCAGRYHFELKLRDAELIDRSNNNDQSEC